jgi:predicted transcriptional regulator
MSQGQIKVHILACVYNRGEVGANAYTIEHKANIPGQEYNRLRGFLDELCSLSLLSKYEQETGGEKVGSRTYYRITQEGKDFVDSYRKSHMSRIFGSIDHFFGSP